MSFFFLIFSLETFTEVCTVDLIFRQNMPGDDLNLTKLLESFVFDVIQMEGSFRMKLRHLGSLIILMLLQSPLPVRRFENFH